MFLFRFFLICCFIMLIGIDSIQAQKLDTDGSQLIEAPFTTSTPVIDGVISSGEWDQAESNTVDFITLGVSGDGADTSDGLEDISYEFSVMYDDLYLYIAVDVTDDIYVSTNYGQRLQWDMPVAWENDAVEYFFDGDMSRNEENNRTPEETATGGQYIFVTEADDAPLPFVTAELQGGHERPYGTEADDVWYAQTVADRSTGDWVQEARFALSIIGSPQPGESIGFNINVDDVDTYDETTLEPDQYIELRDLQLYWTAFLYDAGMDADQSVHTLETLWGTLNLLEPTFLSDWSIY
jgi:hypothetical protein